MDPLSGVPRDSHALFFVVFNWSDQVYLIHLILFFTVYQREASVISNALISVQPF